MLAAELQQLSQSAGNQIVSTSRHAPPTAGIPDHECSSQIQPATPGKIWPAACRQNGCDPDFQRRPQASAQSSNLFVNFATIAGEPADVFVWRTYRGSRPYQIAHSRLATVLPRSWRSGHSYGDHALNLV